MNAWYSKGVSYSKASLIDICCKINELLSLIVTESNNKAPNPKENKLASHLREWCQHRRTGHFMVEIRSLTLCSLAFCKKHLYLTRIETLGDEQPSPVILAFCTASAWSCQSLMLSSDQSMRRAPETLHQTKFLTSSLTSDVNLVAFRLRLVSLNFMKLVFYLKEKLRSYPRRKVKAYRKVCQQS